MDLFRIFRDGRPLEGLPFPSKDPPKLLPVPPNLKGKIGVWGTLTTQNGILGLKIVKLNSLP